VHAPTLAFPPSDGRPLVVTVHDLHFHRHREWYPDGTDALDAMLARLDEADLVIVPTKSVAADVAAASRATDRVRVVPMGTQLRPPDDDERARTLERLEVEQPYVLWVGTVEARRNPEAVIRAFAEVTSKGAPGSQELALYLVGPPGWWSADMAQLLSERGLTERVRRLGVVPHGSLAAIYAGAEAFVFPSLAEGSAMPVLEAMACGAPVVASNRSSLPEVVGNAALLCDPSDDGALADALMKVLRDRELATDLGRLGRERAEQFPWDRTARETAAVYREALEGA
jgi:glycosyltransferase involved in cell wall biosynthesis